MLIEKLDSLMNKIDLIISSNGLFCLVYSVGLILFGLVIGCFIMSAYYGDNEGR